MGRLPTHDPGSASDHTEEIDDIELALLLESVRRKYGYDFRGYTRTSIKRRTLRAAVALGVTSISELQDLVLRDEVMFLELVSLIATSVTEMFRDPEVFAALRTEVLPYLRTYPSRKIWIAGCSTGEEVLSVCILLDEEGLLDRTLIYATDINPKSLEKARKGVLSGDVMGAYTRNYLKAGGRRSLAEYYTADYDAVLFQPRLFDHVVFAEHSLATDAVFSEVQLVTCRNVLIYFERELQDRAVGLFADALCAGGYLCLGSKEALPRPTRKDLFALVAPEHRIYRKRTYETFG